MVIPDGLQNVTPNVKPGWTINVKKTGTGDDEKISEINWTGGSIPAQFSDDFLFAAIVPEKETSLVWKAYETFKNGEIISWDVVGQTKPGPPEGGKGPASKTEVVDSSKKTQAAASTDKPDMKMDDNSVKVNMATGLGAIAIVLSLVAILIGALQRKPKIPPATPSQDIRRDDSTL